MAGAGLWQAGFLVASLQLVLFGGMANPSVAAVERFLFALGQDFYDSGANEGLLFRICKLLKSDQIHATTLHPIPQ